MRRQRIVASLLYLVMPADGQQHPKEIERLRLILSDDFDLDEFELAQLMDIARQAEPREHALQKMASILQEEVSREETLEMLSHMWEMVFADGRVHELEVVFVERVARLLKLSQTDVANVMTSGR